MTKPIMVLVAALGALALKQPLVAQDERLPTPRARLEQAECPFERGAWAQNDRIDCHYLIVSQDRTKAGATIRLPVAILRARTATQQPPLVMLHGGPGLSAFGGMIRGVAQAGLARDRDVVLYDQRGAGLSQPVLCPGFTLPRGTDGVATREQFRQQARACVASLRARQIDPAAYNTSASAADLSELRRALGYPRWDVYGESYGGRLAQEAMRRDRDGIRAVVLSSPTIVGPGRAEGPVSMQAAFARVIAACRASSSCHEAFPRVEEDFHALFDELNRSPIVVTSGSASDTSTIFLDGATMVEGIRRMMRAPAGVALIPLALRELRGPNRLHAAQNLVRRGARPELMAVLFLVECFDQHGPAFDATERSSFTRVATAFRLRRELECDVWQDRFADDDSRRPVRSDSRTLILTGEFDPVAPPEWGRRIAATLPRAVVHEIRTESHNPNSPCRMSIIAEFLADPEKEPDVSCIARLPPIAFATRWP